jgi:hypothetical protein
MGPISSAVLREAISVIPRRRWPTRLPGEIWGIITYFNPSGYGSKPQNLLRCLLRLRKQGLKVLVIEAALGTEVPMLPSGIADELVQLQGGDTLWQKERLLNEAVSRLPPSCDKVVWLDGDILFREPTWIEKVADLLEHYVVVQPYSYAGWLAPHCFDIPIDSEGLVNMKAIERIREGTAYSESTLGSFTLPRGHTGFAWAIRRSVLSEIGFYDRLIVGGGDTVITSAMYGIGGSAVQQPYCSRRQLCHIAEWMQRFNDHVRGSVGYSDGLIFHLWHGRRDLRRYVERYDILTKFDFDPESDIALSPHKLWVWDSDKPLLHKAVRRYFDDRDEDAIEKG